MLKIVYFDESSALDILDIKHEGRLNEITQKMVNKANELSTQIEGEAKVGSGLISLLKAQIKGEAKGSYSRKGSNILTTTLSNTILTSFKGLIDQEDGSKQDKGEELDIISLKDYRLSIVKDSFTFLKTITPFIKVYSNQADIVVYQQGNDNQQNEFDPNNIDVSKFDEILENAKGYYEMLATNNNDQKVVRFNLEGLRNNYQLTDLKKMNLSLYGVKVGSCTIDSLNFEKEIENDEVQPTPRRFDPFKEGNEKGPEGELDIVDVVLAGIE